MNISEADQLIRLGDVNIPYRIEKGRSGRVRISFGEAAELRIVTGNGRLTDFERGFLAEKGNWIRKHYLNLRVHVDRKENFLANIDREIELLGKIVPITYEVSGKTRYKVHEPLKFTIFAPVNHIQERRKLLLYHALRSFAKDYLNQRIVELAEKCEVKFNQLRVKDHKSKWGSCSGKRNINLNWHLIFLEEHLIDYVVIHELMHLHEMNHSKKYWNWVAKYHPDYKASREAIKEKQWLIGILS